MDQQETIDRTGIRHAEREIRAKMGGDQTTITKDMRTMEHIWETTGIGGIKGIGSK